MGVPIVQRVDIAIRGTEYLQHHPRKIVRVRHQPHALVWKRTQNGIPMRLQLIVEKHVLAAADIADAADDAPGLAILDNPCETPRLRQRRPPGVVWKDSGASSRIAVLDEAHNDGRCHRR